MHRYECCEWEVKGQLIIDLGNKSYLYTHDTWKRWFQLDEKHPDSRHGIAGAVILLQDFITTKMAASRQAQRELSGNANTALQLLKRAHHFLRAAPCLGTSAEL